jgi:hypothetical protein
LSDALGRSQTANALLSRDTVDLRALLRDVADWRGLDGDGISNPLLDRLRVAVGLPPLDPPRRYEQSDGTRITDGTTVR